MKTKCYLKLVLCVLALVNFSFRSLQRYLGHCGSFGGKGTRALDRETTSDFKGQWNKSHPGAASSFQGN